MKKGVLFWTLIIGAWIWEFLSLTLCGGTSVVVTCLSLKYYFSQISEEMIKCIENKDYYKLIDTFQNHIIIERRIKLVNREMKYYLYEFVKIIKPCFNTLVYLSHAKDTTLSMKYFTTFVALIIAILLFLMSYLCGCITTCAHNPQQKLYQLLMNQRKYRIPLKVKIKIMRFIERLSGPEIGFYCYNLFPMTSYHFTDYVLDSIASYFLILNFLRRVLT